MSEPPHLRRPTIEDFIFEGEETPLLLRGRVLAGIAIALAALVVVYIVISEAFDVSYSVDAGPLRDWVEDRGIWGPIAFVAFMAVSVLFAPIPNAPIFVAAGLIWGPWLGTTYSMAGMIIGSALSFYTSRILGRRHLGRLIGRRAASRLDRLAGAMGGRLILVARLVPIVNFDWISMLAGLTAMPFRVFIIYSTIGLFPTTVLAVVAGDTLEDDIRITIAIGILWVVGLLLSALYFYLRHKRRKRPNPASRPPAAGG